MRMTRLLNERSKGSRDVKFLFSQLERTIPFFIAFANKISLFAP